jgi:hypothetical protein
MFALDDFGEAACDFIFQFTLAAGSVILPASEESLIMLPREDLEAHLPAHIASEFKAIPVHSGAEVLAALSGGYAKWREYRDRVIDGANPSS